MAGAAGLRQPDMQDQGNILHCTLYKYNKVDGRGGITMQGYTDIIRDEARAYCAWASWSTNSCASSRLIARIVLTFWLSNSTP